MVAVIAAAVVPSGGVRPANAQSSEDLFRYPQTLLQGTVSATVGVQLESCKEFCSARSGCLGFDYSSSDQICRLFASVGGASQNQHYIAGTRSLVTGYHPPANPPIAAQTTEPFIQGPSEAKKQESATSQKTRKPAPVVRAKPRRQKKREATKPRPTAKPTPVSPAPSAPAPAARQPKFRICNNHFGTFSVLASRKCPVSGPGSF
ncbi:PAN domain-containing protein [Mesorhizobium sp. NZP2298]|uniref:PAN domain-containing protein n=1 Tax=Mesorhizobium sp. NZP2298 TaxID=2483403 RepID=UPI001552B3AF|nr:PAN domain-containing protein [Mesorhizobium sp. NZP2298]QKC98780.1 hypothetical protein EB231_32240 [Mesorhizobium sp. NZP2298]